MFTATKSCLLQNCGNAGVPVPKPELRDLICLKGFDWYNLGLILKLAKEDLDTIAKNNRHYEIAQETTRCYLPTAG